MTHTRRPYHVNRREKFTAKRRPTSAYVMRQCRECGCTDDHACLTSRGPCHWVSPTMCSACYFGDRLLEMSAKGGQS